MKLLWLNGIEYEQVDKDDGSLIKIDVTAPSGNKKQELMSICHSRK